MKITADEVVTARQAAIAFLEGATMDRERLDVAIALLIAERDRLAPAAYARLCDRVAWHQRAIGQYHQGAADRLAEGNRKYPHPDAPELVRWQQRTAQEWFDAAETWAQGSRDEHVRARRQRLRVVPTQLRLFET